MRAGAALQEKCGTVGLKLRTCAGGERISRIEDQSEDGTETEEDVKSEKKGSKAVDDDRRENGYPTPKEEEKAPENTEDCEKKENANKDQISPLSNLYIIHLPELFGPSKPEPSDSITGERENLKRPRGVDVVYEITESPCERALKRMRPKKDNIY
ncbi:hypothetical protein H072_9829 [Dactylellina haptotyla CBS 200.50]|uniref:Uncharacterized protein n=1 Tax=Dactylellina haptotyla (strain CBS 200.50) TaxID=1284197 RepID=S8A0R6_DACHA|nr:hypothetical protein H072_9829 [Dactylellina haptotyla CBS 200.50]